LHQEHAPLLFADTEWLESKVWQQVANRLRELGAGSVNKGRGLALDPASRVDDKGDDNRPDDLLLKEI
jgi:hypothetical protein